MEKKATKSTKKKKAPTKNPLDPNSKEFELSLFKRNEKSRKGNSSKDLTMKKIPDKEVADKSGSSKGRSKRQLTYSDDTSLPNEQPVKKKAKKQEVASKQPPKIKTKLNAVSSAALKKKALSNVTAKNDSNIADDVTPQSKGPQSFSAPAIVKTRKKSKRQPRKKKQKKQPEATSVNEENSTPAIAMTKKKKKKPWTKELKAAATRKRGNAKPSNNPTTKSLTDGNDTDILDDVFVTSKSEGPRVARSLSAPARVKTASSRGRPRKSMSAQKAAVGTAQATTTPLKPRAKKKLDYDDDEDEQFRTPPEKPKKKKKKKTLVWSQVQRKRAKQRRGGRNNKHAALKMKANAPPPSPKLPQGTSKPRSGPFRLKKEGDDEDGVYEDCSVQVPLNMLFKDDATRRRMSPIILADVNAVSKQMCLFSKYLIYICRKKYRDKRFFDRLSKNEIRNLHANFRQTGGLFGFKGYCKSQGIQMKKKDFDNRACLLSNATMQFATNILTNLTTHTESRLKTFYNTTDPTTRDMGKKEVAGMVKNLMKTDNDENEWEVNFCTGNPFTWIPPLVSMQKKIRERQAELKAQGKSQKDVRTFRVIPEYKERRQHVMYDNQAMFYLINQSLKKQNEKRLKKRNTWQQSKNKELQKANEKVKKDFLIPLMKKIPKDVIESRKMFHRIFDFEPYERPAYSGRIKKKKQLGWLTKKFNCCVTTNGTVACIHFRKKKKATAKPTMNNFRYLIGIDPGFRYFIGAVTVDRHTNTHTNSLLLSKTWHRNTGLIDRSLKLHHINASCEEERQMKQEKLKNISQSSKNYKLFTRFLLSIQKLKQQTYFTKKYDRLRWMKQQAVRKSLDKLVGDFVTRLPKSEHQELKQKESLTAVFYGDCAVSSRTKRYRRVPVKKLAEAFQRNPNCAFYDTGEYRTSKLCFNCGFETKKARCPDRYTVCHNPTCHVNSTNRDIVGAEGMVTRGLAEHLDESKLLIKDELNLPPSYNWHSVLPTITHPMQSLHFDSRITRLMRPRSNNKVEELQDVTIEDAEASQNEMTDEENYEDADEATQYETDTAEYDTADDEL